MANSIEVRGVTLDYPVYSVKAQSLRNAVLNLAVGGRLMRTRGDTMVVRALSNVSFTLEEGDRLALVGHNGSGKTTLLKVIAGIFEPDIGDVKVRGHVTSMVQLGAGVDWEASGLENIRKMATMRMVPKKVIDERIPAIIEFSELGAFIDMPWRTYSAGMMARLMFAVATELDPDILVLDEWLGAGDAAFREKAGDRMENYVRRAKTVVLGTHDVALVQRVCNKVCLLDAGVIKFFGSTDDYFSRPAAA